MGGSSGPFFLGRSLSPFHFALSPTACLQPAFVTPVIPSLRPANSPHEPAASIVMSPSSSIDLTVSGLGYELVDVERAAGGLLRVTVDLPVHPESGQPGRAITVEDCEAVTRQLQRVFEVEGVAYERLEVSSPGLDRPLKKAADYARFVGEQVEVTLKQPFRGQKRFRG